MRIKHLIYSLLLAFLASCSAPYELAERNLAALYTPGAQFTEPECQLFLVNDSVAELNVKLKLKHFLYSEPTNSLKPQSVIRITASLYESYESKIIIDSTSVLFVDSLYAGQDVLITQSLSLKTKKLTEGLVRIRIQDVKKDDNLFHLIGFNRENLKGAQSFLALDGNNSLIFNKHIAKQDSLRIVYPHPAHDKLFVRFYRRQFPVAVPPFSIDQDNPFDYTADNYFEYPLENGSTPYIQLSDAGFYFFQADSSSRTGMTIYRYGPGFPELTTIEQIFEPLRYITTSREYDALENSPDLKMAIDSFWLEKSGNVNRARSQIAKYYNRVQEANQFFSSYLEGWKTDRGMIYIIFGPPNNVYRQTNTELWVYGEAGHNLSLRFSFVKVNNPFSDNDYSLYRNPMFKEAWYNAVENWRR